MQQSVAGDDGESDADARAWQRAGSPLAALCALREARGEVHELKRYVQRLVREELALAPGRDPWRERSREELDIERSVLLAGTMHNGCPDSTEKPEPKSAARVTEGDRMNNNIAP